jgi:hypothetical protein
MEVEVNRDSRVENEVLEMDWSGGKAEKAARD